MTPSGTQQRAEGFLEQLQREADVLSYGEIESINNILTRSVLILRQAHNGRSPLFKLPIEILHKVLELVPMPYTERWRGFQPFWHNTLLDSSMLIAVIHTCHRLREVALAHPHLWTTFPILLEKLPLVRQMATWSQHIPLNVIGPDISILKELPSNTRFAAIHLHNIQYNDFGLLPTLIEQWSSSALHSLSLFCGKSHRWNSRKDSLPLSPEHAPRLRELALDEVKALPNHGFPHLTHFALINFAFHTGIAARHEFHVRLVQFIRECPRLECIALTGFHLAEEVVDEPLPIPLHHLKHVVLRNFSPNALNHYNALLQPRVNGSSVQILVYRGGDHSFPRRFLFPPNLVAPGTPTLKQVCIGIHPTHATAPDYATSLTAVTTRFTRHLVVRNDELKAHGITPYEWPSIVISQSLTPPLQLPVDEVWLYGFSTTAFPRKCSPLMHFPHAARAVVAIDRRCHYDDVPTLRLLPSTHDHDHLPGSIAISTVRLVHGFSSAPASDSEPHPGPGVTVTYHLPLGQLVKDLHSGGYGYIKHFVLQMTPRMRVAEKELDEVRAAGHFETFTFERIETFPKMPGHSDRSWHERPLGALW